jgi:hypothetical protein
MKLTPINRCLNAKAKFYGLSTFGVIVGAFIMALVWMAFSMPFGIIATMPGYVVGHTVGVMWYKGTLQRLVYWHLPLSRLFGGKSLPPSYNRRYM